LKQRKKSKAWSLKTTTTRRTFQCVTSTSSHFFFEEIRLLSRHNPIESAAFESLSKARMKQVSKMFDWAKPGGGSSKHKKNIYRFAEGSGDDHSKLPFYSS
jgi:hypothetical protein